MQPNVVYLLTDDMGYGDLSCLNERCGWKTPCLDRLAGEGVRFTDAHSSSAVCTPSRYSILTGRYAWRSWLKREVNYGYSPSLVEPGRMTVASLLRDAGYATGCFGKWHLGLDWRRNSDVPGDVDYGAPFGGGPLDHGFDEFFGIGASLDMPPYVYLRGRHAVSRPNRWDPGMNEDRAFRREGKRFWRAGPIAPGFRHVDVTPHTVDEAIGFIRRHAGKRPFFTYLALPSPHTPVVPAPAFEGRSGVSSYGDFCLQVDHEVGRVMAALDKAGVSDDTVFVFASDNGCSPMADYAELAQFGHNPSYIFRGHKADLFEGGHRIPLLVRYPRVVGTDRECGEVVCLGDLLATLAELLGRKLPDDAGEDSVSNLPAWCGDPSGPPLREATVHHSFDGSFSLRRGKWKLAFCPGSGGWSYPRPGSETNGLPPRQLYDMAADVRERRNVIGDYPEVAEEISAVMRKYVTDGRSTPGAPQKNHPGPSGAWPELDFLRTPEGWEGMAPHNTVP